MTKIQTQPRSGNDLQHSGLGGYRIVAKRASGYVVLDAGSAEVQTGLTPSANLSEHWNQRMDELGARRGTWDDLRALLPG